MKSHIDELKDTIRFIPKMQTDSSSKLAAAIFSGNKPGGDQVGHLKTARTV